MTLFFKGLLLAVLAATPLAYHTFDTDFDSAAWKERPVTKVIGLLKDMAGQLQKEADQDEEMYEKLGCWCETNDKEKTKAIGDANLRISDLTAAIEAFTAKTSQLETEIEKLNEEVAKKHQQLVP